MVNQSPSVVSLADKIDQAQTRSKNSPVLTKDTTGQLTTVRPASTQENTYLRGLSSPPVTPLAASQVGMGPDSSKMAGTQAQKQSALSTSLSTAQREEQGRQTTTGAEQGKLEKSANLTALGSVGDKVQSIIEGQFNQLGLSKPAVALGAADQTQTLSPSLTKIQQLVSSNASQADINKAVADWANEQNQAGLAYSTDELTKAFGSPTAAIQAAAAAGISDKLTLTPDVVKTIGYPGGVNQLNQELGLNLTQNSTFQDLQQQIGNLVSQEYQETDKQREIMNSPAASIQERAAARKSLVDSGALGLSAAEAQAADIEQKVAAADQVKIGNETYKLEDLLSDDQVSGLVKKYLTDDNYAKEVKEQLGGFADWIDQNKESLTAMTKQLGGAADSFSKLQDANKAEVTTDAGALSDNVLKAMGLQKISGSAYNIKDTPVMKFLNSSALPLDQKQSLQGALDTLSVQKPDLAKTLLTGNQTWLTKMGSQALTDYASYLKDPNSLSPSKKLAYQQMEKSGKPIDGSAIVNADDQSRTYDYGNALGYKPGEKIPDELKTLSPAVQQMINSGGSLDAGEVSQIASIKDLKSLKTLAKLPPEVKSAVDRTLDTRLNDQFDSQGFHFTSPDALDKELPPVSDTSSLASSDSFTFSANKGQITTKLHTGLDLINQQLEDMDKKLGPSTNWSSNAFQVRDALLKKKQEYTDKLDEVNKSSYQAPYVPPGNYGMDNSVGGKIHASLRKNLDKLVSGENRVGNAVAKKFKS